MQLVTRLLGRFTSTVRLYPRRSLAVAALVVAGVAVLTVSALTNHITVESRHISGSKSRKPSLSFSERCKECIAASTSGKSGGGSTAKNTATTAATGGTTAGSGTAASDPGSGSGGGGGANCYVTSTLVNVCRPWLGAAVSGYPGVTGFAASIANHEARIGRQLDIVHDYRTPGQVLSADDISLARRPGTILLVNWKPTTNWAAGGGSDATVNAQIDAMAASIKSLGSAKIMLAVFHEPENDVSPGGDANCPGVAYKGTDGSVSDYVNMWHNVRARFDAQGVSNVVWVMDYMGYSSWDCLVPDLWPGNGYVDWVMWDSYAYDSGDFLGTESRFYNYLLNNSGGAHDYASKAWGLAEWGELTGSQTSAYGLYDNAKAVVDNGSLPRIKAYVIFDESANGDEDRTSYTAAGAYDPTEQAHYNGFADDPRFTNGFY